MKNKTRRVAFVPIIGGLINGVVMAVRLFLFDKIAGGIIMTIVALLAVVLIVALTINKLRIVEGKAPKVILGVGAGISIKLVSHLFLIIGPIANGKSYGKKGGSSASNAPALKLGKTTLLVSEEDSYYKYEVKETGDYTFSLMKQLLIRDITTSHLKFTQLAKLAIILMEESNNLE